MPEPTQQNILIYRIGQLGDTLVSMPALWAIRRHFSNARLTLLFERHNDPALVTVADLLTGADLIDEFIHYRYLDNSFARAAEMLILLHRIKRSNFSQVIYLPPSNRRHYQIRRDETFFRIAGIRHRLGFHLETVLLPSDQDSRPESELLLGKLSRSGIPSPPSDQLRWDINLQPFERDYIERWANTHTPVKRPLVAFAPGANMPAKRWPPERYAQLGQTLIQEYNIWPVVFGGPQDKALGQELIHHWHCGTNAAGQLPVRLALAAMERCRFFIGNDTGPMHMAASVGLRCVALFSNRDRNGKWHPGGTGHVVLRHTTPCRGCMNTTCARGDQGCLQAISTQQALTACRTLADEILINRYSSPRQSSSDSSLYPFKINS